MSTIPNNLRIRPNLKGKVHDDVSRAMRNAYDMLYDLQDSVVALRSQLRAALSPLTFTGTVNGVNKSFRVTTDPAPSVIQVYVGGALKVSPADYSYVAPNLTMVVAPTSLVIYGT